MLNRHLCMGSTEVDIDVGITQQSKLSTSQCRKKRPETCVLVVLWNAGGIKLPTKPQLLNFITLSMNLKLGIDLFTHKLGKQLRSKLFTLENIAQSAKSYYLKMSLFLNE